MAAPTNNNVKRQRRQSWSVGLWIIPRWCRGSVILRMLSSTAVSVGCWWWSRSVDTRISWETHTHLWSRPSGCTIQTPPFGTHPVLSPGKNLYRGIICWTVPRMDGWMVNVSLIFIIITHMKQRTRDFFFGNATYSTLTHLSPYIYMLHI